ncbi:carbohydrate binding domain-containing protein [Corallincola spongiicola]|uniref:endo-1,4-beta-xylanase n=1 Tax=Corallincola spongiicola TaxID=2520508 RepID=A0ABY1WM00_9GAMM|nr:carbohydrate binding domain-containing protein [Corallincola spongiicola]TAA41836.1 hypothetical protein EXY25_16510 [Corallincola spongiicola]
MMKNFFFCCSCIGVLLSLAFTAEAGRYAGGVPINIDQNVSFNFNIASQGTRTATVWYNNDIAIAIEGANASTYDRATMEKVVALMAASKASFEDFTGLRNLPLNGNYRGLPTIQVPKDNNGYGGLAAHGIFGLSVGSGLFNPFYERIKSGNISIDQVWLYEMNRNYYKSGSNGWNAWIDWACDGNNSNYGYWTVGFNNAAAFWIVDDLGVELHYFGKYYDQFRADHKKDYDKYLSNSSYNFDNVWAKSRLAWRSGTINTLMSATLLEMYDNFGGKPFVQRLYQQLDNNPRLSNRFDHQTARDNWYRAVSRASRKDQSDYFENTLRWAISSGAKATIKRELGNSDGGDDSGVIVQAEDATLYGLFKVGNDSTASAGQYIHSEYVGNYYDTNIEANRAELLFSVPQSGLYALKATTYAPNTAADSFYIEVNDGPRQIWDINNASYYEEMDVNYRNEASEVTIDISAGQHKITVYVREDGARLDRFRLVRIGDGNGGTDDGSGGGGDTDQPSTITVEAETAELYGAFRVGTDSAASAGRYIDSIHQGNYYEGAAINANRAEFTVTATGAGRYQLKGTVYAPESSADSFWIKVNGGDLHLWDTHNKAIYQEMDVNSRGVSEIVEVDLRAGQNTITVYVREDGTRLDQLRLIPIGGDSGGGDPVPDPDPETNLLQNGDFESGNTAGWVPGYSATTAVTTSAYTGNYALSSTNRTEWYHGPKQVVTNTLTVGKTYQLSAWVRMVSGTSSKIESRLLTQDGNGHTWTKLGQVSGSTQWQEITAEFTVTATGSLRQAELYFFGPHAGSEFIVDDVVLTEK